MKKTIYEFYVLQKVKIFYDGLYSYLNINRH